jgi:short-subunit dehydrogenase
MAEKLVTLVTGASSGIGELLAREAAKRGHRLVLTARRGDRLHALADELDGAEVITSDLADPGGPAAIQAALAGRGLSVDVLINNAGLGQRGQVATIALDRQLAQIDVNVRALTELTVRLLPAMVARRRGGILNVASTAAFQPGPNMAVYYATKSYVLSFSEALHEELLPHGIKVSALCPGPTRSEFAVHADMERSELFKRFAGDAAAVARDGLDGLEHNRAVNISGAMNAMMAAGTRFSPRAVNRKLAGWLQQS